MPKHQDLLAEVLETIQQENGDAEMRRMYKECEEVGKEAMSREVLRQILKICSPKTRELLLSRHPDIKEV